MEIPYLLKKYIKIVQNALTEMRQMIFQVKEQITILIDLKYEGTTTFKSVYSSLMKENI